MLNPSPPMQPLAGYERLEPSVMVARATALADRLATRRTVRSFSPDPVPRAVIETAVLAASRAPSGANQQPWHFVALGPGLLRRRLREAAESQERAFYAGRASEEWLNALRPLGTDWQKPFLETAPWVIAVFAERWGEAPDGAKVKHYYVTESVGIAVGFLLVVLHEAGLATLTHTPSPITFLNELCGRPERERAFALIVTGYPARACEVPVAATAKKHLPSVLSWR